jgi:plasmid stabilization system protein ParE
MAFKEKLAREAYQDIDDILDYADSNSKKKVFRKELVERVDFLKEYPEGAEKSYKEFRVLKFIKTPFKLVYRLVQPNIVFVIAIFHQKRDTNFWQNRADKYQDNK